MAQHNIDSPVKVEISRKKCDTLQWRKISFSIKDYKENKSYEKVILDDIEGTATSGRLLAIMGPTGCGKTSLLNVLSCRTKVSSAIIRLEGNVYYNGEIFDQTAVKRFSAYVTQNDTLFSYLTVRETILLAAKFHLPSSVTNITIEKIADGIIRELGLGKCSNTILGSSTRTGISGGERKRVSIAKELISGPQILFLDEPTSGLDSFQAKSVTDALKTLTLNGRIVVTVIHQPRSSIFDLFDDLLLLADGKMMFFGPCNGAAAFFSRIGYPCPTHYNPGDFLLDLISLDTRSEQLEIITRCRISQVGKVWKQVQSDEVTESTQLKEYVGDNKDPDKKFQKELIETEEKEEFQESEMSELLFPFSTKESYGDRLKDELSLAYATISTSPFHCVTEFYRDITCLTWRAYAETFRNWSALSIRFVSSLFFATILSLIYSDLGYTQKNIQDRIGILYFVLTNQCFGPFTGVITVFSQEKRIIEAELSSNSYNVGTYFIGRVLAELPLQIIIPFVYCTIVYWSVGLNPDPIRYLVFIELIVLGSFCAIALGFTVGALAPSPTAANALGAPILIIFILFGGFYINTESLPMGSEWVTYISFIKWCFEGIAVNEFTGETFECPSDDRNACRNNGADVLRSLSFENDYSSQFCAGILVILFAGYLLIAYTMLNIRRERYMRLSDPGKTKNTSENKKAKLSKIVPDFSQLHLLTNSSYKPPVPTVPNSFPVVKKEIKFENTGYAIV